MPHAGEEGAGSVLSFLITMQEWLPRAGGAEGLARKFRLIILHPV